MENYFLTNFMIEYIRLWDFSTDFRFTELNFYVIYKFVVE